MGGCVSTAAAAAAAAAAGVDRSLRALRWSIVPLGGRGGTGAHPIRHDLRGGHCCCHQDCAAGWNELKLCKHGEGQCIRPDTHAAALRGGTCSALVAAVAVVIVSLWLL